MQLCGKNMRNKSANTVQKNNYFFEVLILMVVFLLLFGNLQQLTAQTKNTTTLRNTIIFENAEREYFVHLPKNFDTTKRYWPLVVIHGGGGSGRSYFLADNLREQIQNLGFPAIIITPSFSNTDNLSSRFPTLGEGEFLKQILNKLHAEYKLHDKILLCGYSRGGQFSHRFAFQNPELVKAAAPFAAGTWTTPQGSLLVESLEEISDPSGFLSDTTNIRTVPQRLQNLFEKRVANVAGKLAIPESKNIPFLIMCGTLDPRFEIASQFAKSLKKDGYLVQTVWTKNPHGNKTEYPREFKKYAQNAITFFNECVNED